MRYQFRRALLLAASAALVAAAPRPTAPSDPVPAGAQADPTFQQPYVDMDEWRDAPVRHRYIHGGFKGTGLRFSFYLPPQAQYQGRFFQYVTPVPDSENVSQGLRGEEDRIGFAISSGAYFVETNEGGASVTAGPGLGGDPTIGAYRANAAAAQYSRVVAMQMYGGKRPFGYAFGGSGGAYRTVGGIENTKGVWDGAVPFVLGSPMAIPNVFSVRMHAMRVLQGKFPGIVDAEDAGGSGDPYSILNQEQRDALREVTRMGFPIKSWFGFEDMGVHAFLVLYQGMTMADPAYFKDFWTKPGYLGFNPPASLLKARLQFPATITAALTDGDAASAGLKIDQQPGQGRGTADSAWQSVGGTVRGRPVAFQLNGAPPEVGFLGGDIDIKSGAAAGRRLEAKAIVGDKVILGVSDPKILVLIKPGDQIEIDNSNFLAAQTYHRHQVPGPEYPVWNQFRGPDGKPLYPQRPMLLGPLFTRGAAGTVPTGKFTGKMILLESLYDREAFPWQADWYRARVQENLGDKTDDSFRLWYTDRALHGDATKQEAATQTVSYLGDLQQALRDLSAWVERGVAPPASTNYRIDDGQVVVPDTASARKGIQPVVLLTANGAKKAVVKAGSTVRLTASVAAPPGTGKIVEAAWDFDGSGSFATEAALGASAPRVTVATTHVFPKPGTYFVTLRAYAQRDGDRRTIFARVPNLDRARIVVQ
jgi:hypothetical protein